MAKCDVCGNEYDKASTISGPMGSGTFDSFQSAIHAIAPQCAHCQCRIIGHGVEGGGNFYCCANCAKHAGVTGVADRA